MLWAVVNYNSDSVNVRNQFS